MYDYYFKALDKQQVFYLKEVWIRLQTALPTKRKKGEGLFISLNRVLHHGAERFLVGRIREGV